MLFSFAVWFIIANKDGFFFGSDAFGFVGFMFVELKVCVFLL